MSGGIESKKITVKDVIYILTIVTTSLTSGLTAYYTAKADREDLREETVENAGDIADVKDELKNYNLETMMYILTSIETKVTALNADVKELSKRD